MTTNLGGMGMAPGREQFRLLLLAADLAVKKAALRAVVLVIVFAIMVDIPLSFFADALHSRYPYIDALVHPAVLLAVLLPLLHLFVYRPWLVDTKRRQRAEAERDPFFVLSLDLLVVTGFDGRVQNVSPSVERLLGYTQDEFVGKPVGHFAHPDDKPAIAVELEKRLHSVANGGFECRTRCKDGSYKWLMWTSRPVTADSLICSTGHDITAIRETRDELESRVAEMTLELETTNHELRLSEARYRILAEAAEDLILVATLGGHAAYVNSHAARVFGGQPADFIGRRFDDFLEPTALDTWSAWLKQVIQTGESICGEDSVTISERRFWFGAWHVPLRNDAGEIYAVMTIARDITRQKLEQEALKESEERYRRIVETSPTGLYVASNGKFEAVNPQFERCTGYSQDELVGTECSQLVVAEDRRKVKREAVRMLKGESSSPFQYRIADKHGGTRSIMETVAFVPHNGKRAVLGTFVDITNLTLAEDILRQTIERLDKTLESTVRAVALTVETRDPYTAVHQRRVAQLGYAIAGAMGLPEERANLVRLAGLVHDIGKVRVPAEILSKPEPLSLAEVLLVRDHPRIGHDILSTVEFPWSLARTVLQHHERLDGSGYPDHLEAEDILLEARILAVADVVEAMISHRPYRPAIGLDAALAELRQHEGTLYDPEVVRACCELAEQAIFASICNGQTAAEPAGNVVRMSA